MKYKKNFHELQKKYNKKYPNTHTMRNLVTQNGLITGKKILDVGCGSGLDLDFFQEKGLKVYGIDISPELVAITKEKLPKQEILEGTFNYLPWKDSTFDIIWSKYALQHEKDISISLQEIYRVLKKKGKAFIQVTHPMRSCELITNKNYFQKGEIINYPTIDGNIINEYHHTITEWIQTILQTGFTITYFEEILNRPIQEYSGTISPSAIIFILEKKE